MQKSIWFFIFLHIQVLTWGQDGNASFILIDIHTKSPIEDAHAFINNSSFGDVSNEKGEISISMPENLNEDLIISHISYDTRILENISFASLSQIDSIYLTPNGIKMDEILVTQKRPKGWKKNYKKFKKAFLGSGKMASKCTILNPEVLRFSNENGKFVTSAVDLITIENKYLAYSIDFLLTELTIDKNGSMKYHGYANFKDISTAKNLKKTEKRRQTTYLNSLQHFFEHLIADELEKGQYSIKLVKYVHGVFEEIMTPTVADIIQFDSISQNYHLKFPEFLYVTHLGLKEFSEVKLGVSQGGLESTRFNTRPDGPKSRKTHPTSQLYKIAPQLIIDQYGNILNSKDVQEYGYWADRRMASKLPIDYGKNFSSVENSIPDAMNVTPATEKLPDVQKTAQITSLSIVRDLLYADQEVKEKTLDSVRNHWGDRFVSPLLDFWRFNRNTYLHQQITSLLKDKIGIKNYYEGLQWLWKNKPEQEADHGNIKAEIYQHIDTKFKTYFEDRTPSALINLDEIVWGGVKQDGIPPLRNPEMIEVEDAHYLSDTDVVFGISLEGEQRAYPKRILAWHEFFVDEIAGKRIAGVYCTLCGSMVAYDMVHEDVFHDLGTSGFLYRSNKLMYDKETQSLWSTLEGRPVLGPLAEKNISLETFSVVTTTWGDWKSLHPDTKVLSLSTGYNRNYAEGEAYKDYFSTDALMFPVPAIDSRLNNKDEVLIVRVEGYQNDPLAISIDYLKKENIHQDTIAQNSIVAISGKDGTSRVYEASDVIFKTYKNGKLTDGKGNIWKVTEAELIGPKIQKLRRIPSHNAFWFGWYNVYPHTRLIHK